MLVCAPLARRSSRAAPPPASAASSLFRVSRPAGLAGRADCSSEVCTHVHGFGARWGLRGREAADAGVEALGPLGREARVPSSPSAGCLWATDAGRWSGCNSMTMSNNGECDLACMTQACGYDGGGFDCAQVKLTVFVVSRVPRQTVWCVVGGSLRRASACARD